MENLKSTTVRQEILLEAVKNITSSRKQLNMYASECKSSISLCISRHMDALRSRELWLLNQVDLIRQVKDETLKIQEAEVNQILGSFMASNNCDSLQLRLLKKRLDTFDLQPHEIPIISFLPDDGSLKRGILTFGRISDGQDINEMMSPLFNAKREDLPEHSSDDFSAWLPKEFGLEYNQISLDNLDGRFEYFSEIKNSPIVNWLADLETIRAKYEIGASYPIATMKYFREVCNETKHWLQQYGMSQKKINSELESHSCENERVENVEVENNVEKLRQSVSAYFNDIVSSKKLWLHSSEAGHKTTETETNAESSVKLCIQNNARPQPDLSVSEKNKMWLFSGTCLSAMHMKELFPCFREKGLSPDLWLQQHTEFPVTALSETVTLLQPFRPDMVSSDWLHYSRKACAGTETKVKDNDNVLSPFDSKLGTSKWIHMEKGQADVITSESVKEKTVQIQFNVKDWLHPSRWSRIDEMKNCSSNKMACIDQFSSDDRRELVNTWLHPSRLLAASSACLSDNTSCILSTYTSVDRQNLLTTWLHPSRLSEEKNSDCASYLPLTEHNVKEDRNELVTMWLHSSRMAKDNFIMKSATGESKSVPELNDEQKASHGYCMKELSRQQVTDVSPAYGGLTLKSEISCWLLNSGSNKETTSAHEKKWLLTKNDDDDSSDTDEDSDTDDDDEDMSDDDDVEVMEWPEQGTEEANDVKNKPRRPAPFTVNKWLAYTEK